MSASTTEGVAAVGAHEQRASSSRAPSGVGGTGKVDHRSRGPARGRCVRRWRSGAAPGEPREAARASAGESARLGVVAP